jgi:hypothetical protein
MSELENPNPVQRSASHEPCGRRNLKDSRKQRVKCTAASIDVFQQTIVINWRDAKLDHHKGLPFCEVIFAQ